MKRFVLFLSLLAALSVPAPLLADYRLWPVAATSSSGGPTSGAYGINDIGQVVGYRLSQTGVPEAFVFERTVTRSLLPSSSAVESYASDINDLGQVVGYSRTVGSASTQAFLWEGGVVTMLGPCPAGESTVANDVNGQGEVVGTCTAAATGATRGFSWKKGAGYALLANSGFNTAANGINELGAIAGGYGAQAAKWLSATSGLYAYLPSGASVAVGNDVNASGTLVGSASTTTASQAYLWNSDGSAVAFGGNSSEAYAVNDAGVVVGRQMGASGAEAFVYDSNTGSLNQLQGLVDASGLGWRLEEARDINSHGYIVGVGVVYNARRAFLLVPNGQDLDGDGSVTPADCADQDASIGPGAAEACDGLDNDCDGIVDDGCPRQITATASGPGMIEPAGAVSVATGSNATFFFRPDAGSTVWSVVVDGYSMPRGTSYTFYNVTADHTIAVTFGRAFSTITASAGPGGSISPSGGVQVAYSASQTFTISPAPMYKTVDVVVDGVSKGPLASYTFSSVVADHSISASFAEYRPLVTVGAYGGGTISPAGDLEVPYGGDLAFTVTPAPRCTILDVTVDGSSVGAVSSYALSGITADHKVIARFDCGIRYRLVSLGNLGGVHPYGGYAESRVRDMNDAGDVVGFSYAVHNGLNVREGFLWRDGVGLTPLGDLPGGNFASEAEGINNAGQVVGGSVITTSLNQNWWAAFLWSDGVMVGLGDEDPLNTYTSSWAHDINNLGEFISWPSMGSGDFLVRNGVWTRLTDAVTGATMSMAVEINDRTEVVNANSIWRDGAISSLGTLPGTTATYASALNNSAQVVGSCGYTVAGSSSYDGFLWDGGVMTNLGHFPDHTRHWTEAEDINDNGDIVGCSVDASGSLKAAVWLKGLGMFKLGDLVDPSGAGWSIGLADAINNRGQIAGIGLNPQRTAWDPYRLDPDADGDASFVPEDCADDDATSFPGAPERCDAKDNDCDGVVDDGADSVIDASAGPGGTIAPAGSVAVACGGAQTFTISPAENRRIADVVVDGVSVGPVASYTFSDVRASHTIAASFAAFGAVTVVAPNGGETIDGGATFTIAWGAPSTSATFNLWYSVDDGATWKGIARGVAGYAYVWTPNVTESSARCRVKVEGVSGKKVVGSDVSDGSFTLSKTDAVPAVTVTAPDGGEVLASGQAYDVSWGTGTTAPIAKVVVAYTLDGRSWTPIATLASNPGALTWTVPAVARAKTKCLVEVSVYDSGDRLIGSDRSDGVFTIKP